MGVWLAFLFALYGWYQGGMHGIPPLPPLASVALPDRQCANAVRSVRAGGHLDLRQFCPSLRRVGPSAAAKRDAGRERGR